MEDFLSFGLPESLINSLKHLQFTKPTPVQAQSIPPAMEGKDILGSAQTGTGKTGAFGIPLIAHLIANPRSCGLVMTPTRELAVQVIKMMIELVGQDRSIKPALLIGGEPIFKQLRQLKSRPRLIVGTPGRINDHILRGTLRLQDTRFLVLDETDRMLDMGFAPQIEKIVCLIPEDRQTLLFSATLPKNIMSLAQQYMKDPVRIAVGPTTTPVAAIKQGMLYLAEGEKYNQLVTELNTRDGAVIVFVKTKFGAEKMAEKLRREKHSADAIHGDLRHGKRERVIKDFRDCKYRIMVATDIAARGLDISHVKHVINYDLPQCHEDYVHRIGRTARAGAEGEAMSFVTPSERAKWKAIHRFINPDAKEERDSEPRERSGKRFPSRFKKFGSSNTSGRSDNKVRHDSHRSNNPPQRSSAPQQRATTTTIISKKPTREGAARARTDAW